MVRPTRGDLVAGITVALVLVPQAIAYALLAGVPPVHGLYAAAAAPIVAGLVGSSPYLQTGPVALTSLLTFGALAPSIAVGTEDYAAHAALLALIVGATRFAVGALQGGFVAYLMSQPVVAAFTLAAAVLDRGLPTARAARCQRRLGQPAVAGDDALSSPASGPGWASAIGLAVRW